MSSIPSDSSKATDAGFSTGTDASAASDQKKVSVLTNYFPLVLSKQAEVVRLRNLELLRDMKNPGSIPADSPEALYAPQKLRRNLSKTTADWWIFGDSHYEQNRFDLDPDYYNAHVKELKDLASLYQTALTLAENTNDSESTKYPKLVVSACEELLAGLSKYTEMVEEFFHGSRFVSGCGVKRRENLMKKERLDERYARELKESLSDKMWDFFTDARGRGPSVAWSSRWCPSSSNDIQAVPEQQGEQEGPEEI